MREGNEVDRYSDQEQGAEREGCREHGGGAGSGGKGRQRQSDRDMGERGSASTRKSEIDRFKERAEERERRSERARERARARRRALP